VTDGVIQDRGLVLWVTRNVAACKEVLEPVAREFKLQPLVCPPANALEAIRQSRCELIGVELDDDPSGSIALLRELHERLPRVTLLAACGEATTSLMRAALEAGAADMLSLPLGRLELNKALIKFVQLRERTFGTRAEAGEILTVYGARGGLGATTLAVNLAVRLRALTANEVGIVDLDLQRGDVSAFLNLSPTQSLASLAGARTDVDDIFLHGTMTRHGSGVFVLAAPQRIEEAEAVSHDDSQLALRLLRGQFRYTVVDTPRTIGGAVVPAFEQADHILVLSDQTVPGVRAAQRFFELLRQLGDSRDAAKLILTQTGAEAVPLKDVVRTIGREPFAVLPRDEAAATHAMNSGLPLNGGKPGSLTTAIADLAAKLSGVAARPKSRAGGQLLRRIFAREART
jgi:pilus assembly protein CpaE